MKLITQINFTKSIDKKWLIYKESYYDKFDTLTHILATLALSYSTYVTFISKDKLNENEKFVIYLFIFASTVICFVTFKKLTEKRLKVIETKNTEQENKKQLKKLSQEKGWFEYRSNPNTLIFHEDAGDWNKYIKIFLFKDNKIYYTILTERFKLNYPTFTENHSVKKLLESLSSK